MIGKLYKLLGVMLLSLSTIVHAQTQSYEITGSVIDSRTSEVLVGTNLQIQETRFGATTNIQGEFRIEALLEPGDYTLLIRYVGYQGKNVPVTLGDQTTIDLGALELREDVLGLEELVVTGTTVPTRRRELGNAVSTTRMDDVVLTGATSVDQALSGRIAGAQVSINSGRPDGGISIRLRGTSTVLGAADPLYIVDGVIINNDSPELVDVGGGSSNRLSDINPQDIERIEVVKGAAAAALYGSRANNGVVQIFTRRGQSGAPRVTYNTRFMTDKIRKTLDVNMHPTDAAGNPVERYDHQDFIFRRGYGTEQNLSVSGGTDQTTYYLSGSYLFREGISRGNDYTRGSGRLRLDQTITDWASATMSAQYTNSHTNDVPHGGIAANYGSLTGFIFGPNTYDPRPVDGIYPDNGILANPVEVIDRFDHTNDVSRFIGSFQLNLTPIRNLGIDYIMGFDTHTQTGKAFIPPGNVAPGVGTGFSRRSTREVQQMNNDLNLRYEYRPGDWLTSRTLVGGTMQFEQREVLTGESSNLPPVTRVSSAGSDQSLGESRSELVVYGAFLQQTFAIQNRLFLTGAARVDASSSFAEDERWQFYPKISASYLVSEEDFWRSSGISNIINEFSIRGSLGESGGLTAIGPFDRFTNYPLVNYDGQPGLIPGTSLGTPDLRPERQRELELGFDMSFLDNRLYFEFTWYDQQTEDLLLQRTIAPTTGFSTALENVGTMENRGIELVLRALPINTPRTSWSSTVTFATYRNEVDGIEGDVLAVPRAFGQVAAVNGEPLGVYYSTMFARDNDGNIITNEAGIPQREVDEDGSPVSGVIGDPNPDFTASWINDLSIGERWNVRFQLDASYGNDVFNFTRRLAALGVFGTLTDYENELAGELPEGYNAAVFNIFENWVEDGSYLKLREFSVSYTFFPDVLGLNSLRASLVGRNLISIDNYSGYDPEINVSGQSTVVRGFDFVEIPAPRTFSIGLTANF